MKYNEIKSLGLEECAARLAAARENGQKLRFSHAISPIKNPMRLQHNKRLVARLKTAVRALRKPNK